MQDFKKLAIYQRSLEHCAVVYKFSASLPVSEKYGLVSQIRRAACSIPLNISEGAGAATRKEFSQFVGYAYRSVNEVMTCLELVDKLNMEHDLRIGDSLTLESIELSRMIYAFLKKLGN